MNGWIITYWIINAVGLAAIRVKHNEETRHNFLNAFFEIALAQFLLYMNGAFN